MSNLPPDLSVHLPVELFESLCKVIETGIQRADIPSGERKNIASWWEAEEEFLLEDLADNNQTKE